MHCTHQPYKQIWAHPLPNCRNLTLRECEFETHTPEMGRWIQTLFRSEVCTKSYNPAKLRDSILGNFGTPTWAMVNLVSPQLLVACPNTKGVPKNGLTNFFVGLM
jgi:hypothetical protein